MRQSTHKRAVARAVGVNPKNIYRTSTREQQDLLLKHQIKKIHKQDPAYGHKRISWKLGINKKRVLRVMKKYDIKPPRGKRRDYLTQSTPHHNYCNLITDMSIDHPNQLWCSDLSYIKFQGKFWYLATIIDVYTRQVLSVQVGSRHDSQLVLMALRDAFAKSQALPQIFHSDQGKEFMAGVVTEYLESKGVKISVSDKASPWQNGYQESFFGKFKLEFGDVNRFESVGMMMEAIYHHIHYYNHKRIHTSLKMPPAKFAAEFFRHSSS